jgi:hypothetical protein
MVRSIEDLSSAWGKPGKPMTLREKVTRGLLIQDALLEPPLKKHEGFMLRKRDIIFKYVEFATGLVYGAAVRLVRTADDPDELMSVRESAEALIAAVDDGSLTIGRAVKRLKETRLKEHFRASRTQSNRSRRTPQEEALNTLVEQCKVLSTALTTMSDALDTYPPEVLAGWVKALTDTRKNISRTITTMQKEI